MERVPVSPETVTVLGHKVKRATDPLWAGLFLEHAMPATQSSLMLMICGKDAPVDIHLRVPWCHPEDREGTKDDWTDCIYRVRPRMQPGKKWKGQKVKSVAFERWQDEWWIAYEVEPPKATRS
jgi:hypothetical protein